MRILFPLTYYRPHVSGLTIYLQRTAQALAKRGHAVTVLTSQYDWRLPREEIIANVRVVREPVWARVGKGVIMPGYVQTAARLMREHDVVVPSLPTTPMEALCLPLLARFVARRPIAMIYQCDINLPPGFMNRVIGETVIASCTAAVALADRTATMTLDYAQHSRVLRKFLAKTTIIPPPVDMIAPQTEAISSLRQRLGLGQECTVGFVARLASEKGVEYALQALPRLLEAFSGRGVKVIFVGDHSKVIGERAYARRLQPMLDRYRDHCVFAGELSEGELAALYATCDVTILPSINMTEAFGMVQVESMLCGTPVVVSDLPGVRQPVMETGMGRVVPPKNAAALAEAIIDVVCNRDSFVRPRVLIEALYGSARTADLYERLLGEMVTLARGSHQPPNFQPQGDETVAPVP